jgi:hypothetical protein
MGRVVNIFRFVLPCIALLLAGCGTALFDIVEQRVNPIPDARQQKLIGLEILKITASMKSVVTVETTEAGPNEALSGIEQWTVCGRVTFPSRTLYYTFFVRSEKVVEWRQAVLNDKCEERNYRPAIFSNSSSIY